MNLEILRTPENIRRVASALLAGTAIGLLAGCGEQRREPIKIPPGAIDMGLVEDYDTRGFLVKPGQRVDCGYSTSTGDNNMHRRYWPPQNGRVRVDCPGTGRDYPVERRPAR